MESVEDKGFRLPPTETRFSSIGWSISAPTVVADTKSNTFGVTIDADLSQKNVLEMQRDYHLLDYCGRVRNHFTAPGSRVLVIESFWE